MKVTLTRYTPEPELAIVEAAATCWQSVPREGVLHHIIKAGHWTPLEFATFNFRIEGVSRALTHQLVRKRVGVAFCQESQRRIEYGSRFNYIVPESIRESTVSLAGYKRLMEAILDIYEQLIEGDIPAEDARYVLPNACTATIDMSINYHALLDLCGERLCSRAQWEIRELMECLKAEVEKVSPKLAGYLRPKCYWLGRCPEAKSCWEWEYK